ncbi:MAG: pilin [Micromonosporaceae bacterium]
MVRWPAFACRTSRRTRVPARVAWSVALGAVVLAAVLVVVAGAAHAADADGAPVAAKSIEEVVKNLRLWLVGILATVATFFLTFGALRYIAAGGDMGEVEKAKSALWSAGIGYGLALLAPVIISVIKEVLK